MQYHTEPWLAFSKNVVNYIALLLIMLHWVNGRNETGRDVWLESLALIHTTDESREEKKSQHLSGRYHPQLPNGLTKPSKMCDIHQQTLLYNGKKKKNKNQLTAKRAMLP